MKGTWWKMLAVMLVLYSIIAGFLAPVPALHVLHETIRNLYFHVTMWFGMIILFTISMISGIRYLGSGNQHRDTVAEEGAHVGLLFGVLGLITGMIWARYTWGTWWTIDPQLNGAAATLLCYFAYFILRRSMDEEQKRGRVAAVYSIFAYTLMLVFIGILPRITDSLHPGKGGNPGFGAYDDLDGRMRLVFYPAVIGWTLLGWWIVQLRVRMRRIQNSIVEDDTDKHLVP